MFMHYMPAHWKERLHSNEVRAEFSAMYQMKILIFIEEILSLIVAPWILLRNANHRCERVIDFFREQTVHVDGIGYQCGFAYFNFKKDPNAENPTTILDQPDGLRDDYYGLKDNKMLMSMQHFEQMYSHYNQQSKARRIGGWQPPPAWPSVIPQEAIVEESGTHLSPRVNTIARSMSNRMSGMLDSKRLRSPHNMRSPPQGPRMTSRKTRFEQSQNMSDIIEPESGRPAHGVSESKVMSQDSDLHDYDMHGAKEDALESDTDDNDVTNGGAGVLGMLQQFARAQTDNGKGVAI